MKIAQEQRHYGILKHCVRADGTKNATSVLGSVIGNSPAECFAAMLEKYGFSSMPGCSWGSETEGFESLSVWGVFSKGPQTGTPEEESALETLRSHTKIAAGLRRIANGKQPAY